MGAQSWGRSQLFEESDQFLLGHVLRLTAVPLNGGLERQGPQTLLPIDAVSCGLKPSVTHLVQSGCDSQSTR
jgi:hypothetical protein